MAMGVSQTHSTFDPPFDTGGAGSLGPGRVTTASCNIACSVLYADYIDLPAGMQEGRKAPLVAGSSCGRTTPLLHQTSLPICRLFISSLDRWLG